MIVDYDISWPVAYFSSSVPATNSLACFGSHLSFNRTSATVAKA